MITTQDLYFLRRCLDLARMANRLVAPNPYVGAVIVHDGHIIGEGYHPQVGEPHAEVFAINSVTERDKLADSTMYVSLEPCAHFGRTPPCADLIMKHRLKRVVIGMQDPNPKVDGGGIARLRTHGIEVEVLPTHHPLSKAFQVLNQVFLTNMVGKRPFITLKWAETGDGFLAGINMGGQPYPIAITGTTARARVHALRAQHQGILVGRRTASIDRPKLSTRYFPGPDPIRMVMDRHVTVADEVHAATGNETWIINQKLEKKLDNRRYIAFPPNTSLEEIMHRLFVDHGLCSILIEGGTMIHTAFLEKGLFDQVYRFVNPHLQLGKVGVAAPVLPLDWLHQSVETLGHDQLMIYGPTEQSKADV